MYRLVKLAVRILVVEHVMPFRCTLIPLSFFVPHQIGTKGGAKRSDLLALFHQVQTLLALDDQHLVCLLSRDAISKL